ncbi:GDSL lipase/acylhydrolase [Obba rivulosa]|uniref:GDSL lipase/acylhydrolase n=1 Tax=Obba rivulosa TaxID=1052685 RepID=A0A8E2DTR9_9APHY|nr:GDSL lipase/acylhydrolase [Obba rivulosa]
MALVRLLALVAIIVSAWPVEAVGPAPNQIKNLVTFGDSYTDVVSTGDNGTAWPVYAARDGHFTLFPFARSGATCSQALTPRDFPPLFQSQLPAYFAEVANHSIRVPPEETIYTLWLGTNDVGVGELITGGQTPGVTLVDTVGCQIDWAKTLYQSGARNFLFQAMLPLQHVVLYSADSYPNRYWTLERNTTEWNVFMTEIVSSANKLQELMIQQLAPTLPGAHIGVFDSFGLFSDMIAHPASYLNGTAPLNVTGCIRSCVFKINESTADTGDCTIAEGTDRDSFLWYDELHPSEQADRVVAREIAAAINRQSSQWTTWFS